MVNAIFSVQKSDIIRGLWFAFHTRVQATNSAEAVNLLENICDETPTQFKNPLSYFVQFPIQQIDLSIGGELVVINAQAIQLLHITDDGFSDGKPTYHDPRLRSTKMAYFIDLRRFSGDLFGSSAKQTTTVQVQISLLPGSITMKGQPAGWVVGAANGDQAFNQFSFMSYLETMGMMDLKGG